MESSRAGGLSDNTPSIDFASVFMHYIFMKVATKILIAGALVASGATAAAIVPAKNERQLEVSSARSASASSNDDVTASPIDQPSTAPAVVDADTQAQAVSPAPAVQAQVTSTASVAPAPTPTASPQSAQPVKRTMTSRTPNIVQASDPDREDVYCNYTFDDGSTASIFIGQRPKPNSTITVEIGCPIID